MALTATVSYKGALRTEATHLRSGQELITDAPPDNNGKGEAFSPTDLVATALGSCMVTVMGIKAQSMGFDLGRVDIEVEKVMASAPRRIAAVNLHIRMFGEYDLTTQQVLEQTGINCPVAKSLNPELAQNVKFVWE